MNDEIFCAFPYYRELAYYIKKLEQHEMALPYFDQAIAITPTDHRTLVGRAIVKSKIIHHKEAINDLNTALKNKPDDLIVLAHKALSTYLSCEFEEALIQNFRNSLKRTKPESFVMGIMHCTEAIQNCVGARAGRPLRDYYKLIRKMAWKEAMTQENTFKTRNTRKKKTNKKKDKLAKAIERIETKEKSKSSALISKSYPTLAYSSDLEIRSSLYSHESEDYEIPTGPPYAFKPLQRKTKNIENYMSEKYLDRMYLDRKFLKNLKHCDGVNSPNVNGTKNILKMAKHGYKLLSYKEELIRTRRPFYFIKYQEANISPTLKKRLNEDLEKTRENAKRMISKMFHSLEKCIKERNTQKAMEIAEKIQIYCHARTTNILPQKDYFIECLYDLVGMALTELKRLNYTQSAWDRQKRIYQMLGFPISRTPSRDSVVNQFKEVFIDYKKTIKGLHDRLEEARTLEECAFIYYELCRLYIDQKQYDLAQLFGKKCVSDGYRSNNMDWVINAKMLLIRIDIQQRNRGDARLRLNEVLYVAHKLGNKVLVDYVMKCLDIINTLDFDEPLGYKIVKEREKAIIGMISETKIKQDVSYLFRIMAAKPATRRMSIMPGIRFTDNSTEKKIEGKSYDEEE